MQTIVHDYEKPNLKIFLYTPPKFHHSPFSHCLHVLRTPLDHLVKADYRGGLEGRRQRMSFHMPGGGFTASQNLGDGRGFPQLQ